jgi:phthalate 3,4-dioxygenase ferredoxin reductase subunit
MTAGTVIVGSSVAGVHTALALRAAGYREQVTLVGAEVSWPYDRPPLSKGFLAGEPLPSLLTVEQARAHDVRVLLGHKAVGLDLAARCLHVEALPDLRFDHLVIATGARARRPRWPLPAGAHLLRDVRDAEALRTSLARGGRLVVIGAGFIGAEVAATARGYGMDVSMVDPLPGPLYRAIGREPSARIAGLHEANGVHALFGVGVERVAGSAGDLEVHLTDGRILPSSTVAIGIGAEPDVEWLRGCGLVLDDGIVCDQYCAAQGTNGVYAAGDVARWFHRTLGRHVRVEHWTNAVTQATAVATIIAQPAVGVPYAPSQYVWSDQYDWRISLVGETTGTPSLVERDERQFAYLYGGEGQLAGAMVVNWPKAVVGCRQAVDRGTAFIDVAEQLTGGTISKTAAGTLP